MHWLNPCLGACFRKELQSLVMVALNHLYSVYKRYTRRKDGAVGAVEVLRSFEDGDQSDASAGARL